MLLSSIVYPHFLIFRILQLIIPLLYIKLNRTEHFSTASPSFFSTFTIRINLIPFLYQLHTPLLILPLRMHIQIQRQIHRRMPQQLTDHLIIRALFHTACCKRMPLRYNNDKQKKPLFSRGLSVCRLLFNSFSKLKIDENYKEKRRLFY